MATSHGAITSREDAHAAVLRITKKFGFVRKGLMDKIEQWDPEAKAELEEMIIAKDKLAGHSILT